MGIRDVLFTKGCMGCSDRQEGKIFTSRSEKGSRRKYVVGRKKPCSYTGNQECIWAVEAIVIAKCIPILFLDINGGSSGPYYTKWRILDCHVPNIPLEPLAIGLATRTEPQPKSY